MDKKWKSALTLTVAGSALVLSILSFVAGTIRDNASYDRSTKIRLIEQIDKFYVEALKNHLDQAQTDDPNRITAINGMWETRKKIFADDILWLVMEIPDLVTSDEYSNLAGIMTNLGRIDDARQLAENAVQHASDQRDIAAANRRLARVLFKYRNERQLDQGRLLFRESIDWYIQRDSDQDLLSGAFTYGVWADLEAEHNNSAESVRLMRVAVEQYSRVSRHDIARAQIEILNAKIKLLGSGSKGE